jgi:predicted naringenin-chalcone synthase
MDPIEVLQKRHLKKEMIFTVASYWAKSTRQSIEKSGWKPEDLDYNYCELHWNYDSFIRRLLKNKLKLRQDIVRLPVTEMGCAGISGIIYAKNFV